jgi:hypothetical protein
MRQDEIQSQGEREAKNSLGMHFYPKAGHYDAAVPVTIHQTAVVEEVAVSRDLTQIDLVVVVVVSPSSS